MAGSKETRPNLSIRSRISMRGPINAAHHPEVALPHANSALNRTSSVNSDRIADVWCRVRFPGLDLTNLFHFSADRTAERRGTTKYHQQIQAYPPGIWGPSCWHAKCNS